MTSKIAQLESEILRLQVALAALQAPLAAEFIPCFSFEFNGRSCLLTELFGESERLLIIHNMGAECPYCAAYADGIDGVYRHIKRLFPVYICSCEPSVQRYGFEMHRWQVPLIFDKARTFTKAMGFLTPEGGDWPGMSAFRRLPDGNIQRYASRSFEPGDSFSPFWPVASFVLGLSAEEIEPAPVLARPSDCHANKT